MCQIYIFDKVCLTKLLFPLNLIFVFKSGLMSRIFYFPMYFSSPSYFLTKEKVLAEIYITNESELGFFENGYNK